MSSYIIYSAFSKNPYYYFYGQSHANTSTLPSQSLKGILYILYEKNCIIIICKIKMCHQKIMNLTEILLFLKIKKFNN